MQRVMLVPGVTVRRELRARLKPAAEARHERELATRHDGRAARARAMR
jgi:hypothetical protein